MVPSERPEKVKLVPLSHPEETTEVNAGEVDRWASYSTLPTPESVTLDQVSLLAVPEVNSGSAVRKGAVGALASWVEKTTLE